MTHLDRRSFLRAGMATMALAGVPALAACSGGSKGSAGSDTGPLRYPSWMATVTAGRLGLLPRLTYATRQRRGRTWIRSVSTS